MMVFFARVQHTPTVLFCKPLDAGRAHHPEIYWPPGLALSFLEEKWVPGGSTCVRLLAKGKARRTFHFVHHDGWHENCWAVLMECVDVFICPLTVHDVQVAARLGTVAGCRTGGRSGVMIRRHVEESLALFVFGQGFRATSGQLSSCCGPLARVVREICTFL